MATKHKPEENTEAPEAAVHFVDGEFAFGYFQCNKCGWRGTIEETEEAVCLNIEKHTEGILQGYSVPKIIVKDDSEVALKDDERAFRVCPECASHKLSFVEVEMKQ